MSAQDIRNWLVEYIYQWENFPVVGDHAHDYLHSKKTQLVAWCDFIKQTGNRADELTFYLLSRICNVQMAVIGKDTIYYSHTLVPELSHPMDCDIIFTYLGNNNFHEVKMCSTCNDKRKSGTKSDMTGNLNDR